MAEHGGSSNLMRPPGITWTGSSQPGRLTGALNDLFGGKRCFGVVGQAQWRVHLDERESFAGSVELPAAQQTDVGQLAALGLGHFPGRVDLRGGVEQSEELRGRVAGDLVVQALRCLGGEDEPEPVLAGLRGVQTRAVRQAANQVLDLDWVRSVRQLGAGVARPLPVPPRLRCWPGPGRPETQIRSASCGY